MVPVVTWSPNGIRNTKTGKEHALRQNLTRWIEDSGGVVYWGECPEEYDHPTFSIVSQAGLSSFGDGGEKEDYHPDMIAIFDDYCVVVELKVGAKYKEPMNGAWETFDYWQKYEREKPTYVAEDNSYTPNSFVLATRCSPYGHLFPAAHEFLYENEHGPINDDLPKYEGNMTGLLARMLGRFARGSEDQSVGLGVLVSSVLENLNGQQDDLDSEKMMRARDLRATGSPAIYQRVNGRQDWKVLG